MTRRMWTIGLAVGALQGLCALGIGMAMGIRVPVVRAALIFFEVALVLVAIHLGEWFCQLADDAQVSRETLREYEKVEPRG